MSRPFADVLRDLTGGQTYDDLTLQLGELVNAVIEHRKAGELTLKLAIAPNGEGSVKIKDKVTVKSPEPTRGETLFFTTSSGSLVRNDPRQERLPLRDVADKAETREVNHA
jgi:hypothetical protein